MNTSATSSKTRSIAFVGLSIALIAVSAWITVPIGPIPFTLQMLSISFIIYALKPSWAIAAIYGYVALGALGVPVFSGMRGGIGVIMGPTGGFIAGYLIGVPLAVGLLYLVRKARENKGIKEDAQTEQAREQVQSAAFSVDASAASATMPTPGSQSFNINKPTFLQTVRNCGWGIIAGLLFVGVSYSVGTLQYTFVAHVGVEAALTACVIPFVVPDVVKVVLGVAVAQAVNSAVNLRK